MLTHRVPSLQTCVGDGNSSLSYPEFEVLDADLLVPHDQLWRTLMSLMQHTAQVNKSCVVCSCSSQQMLHRRCSWQA